MPKRRTPPRHNSPSAGATADPDLPSLLELERFTTASLHQWLTAATRMEGLHRALYFGLETLRQRDGSRLIDAVRSCTRDDFYIDHWSRIVDYRYSLEPLSIAGSLKNNGGRFNIGAVLSPGAFTAFPALYCAEDYPTAFLERFGGIRCDFPRQRRRVIHHRHRVGGGRRHDSILKHRHTGYFFKQRGQQGTVFDDALPDDWGRRLLALSATADGGTPTRSTVSQSNSGVNPKLNLAYQLNDNVLLYATATKGFRRSGARASAPASRPDYRRWDTMVQRR